MLKTPILQKKLAQKLTEEQKLKIRDMLRQGVESKAIAEYVGVTSGQVAAIAAHITMGSYDKEQTKIGSALVEEETPSSKILSNLEQIEPSKSSNVKSSILLGENIETGEDDYWDPFPESGSTNPHALIVGESGVGKTETIRSVVTELAQKGINSIIFDYGQGFSLDDANKSIEKFIIKCFRKSVNKIIVITGKGLRSKSNENPYVSENLSILKYSVPDFIKSKVNLIK